MIRPLTEHGIADHQRVLELERLCARQKAMIQRQAAMLKENREQPGRALPPPGGHLAQEVLWNGLRGRESPRRAHPVGRHGAANAAARYFRIPRSSTGGKHSWIKAAEALSDHVNTDEVAS